MYGDLVTPPDAEHRPAGRLGALDALALRVVRDPRRVVAYPRMLLLAALLIAAARVVTGAATKVDFVAFYTAGAFVRDARTADLSSIPAQLAFQEDVLHAGVRSIWVSPPLVAWAFAPLAALPYPTAVAAFVALGAALFALAVAVARRATGLDVPLGSLLLRSLSYFPAFAWLTFAQTSAISLLLHCAAFAALARRRDVLGGAFVGLFAFKPQQALALVIALVVARRWRALAGAALTAGAFVALSAMIAPAESRAWLAESPRLFAFLRSAGYNAYGLHSLYGASALLLDGVSRGAATTLAAALGVACAAWLVWLWARVRWEPAGDAWRLAWAATVAASTLLSPHLYFYDLAILLLPAWIAFSVWKGPKAFLDDGPIASATAWVWALGFVGPYVTMAMLEPTSAAGHPFAVQLGVIAVAVWTARVGREARARAS